MWEVVYEGSTSPTAYLYLLLKYLIACDGDIGQLGGLS